MSSSTRTNLGDTLSASEQPIRFSSSSRRWSRNLSAQRNRELNRLNQVEKWRQALELRGQEDLFERMSSEARGNPDPEPALPAAPQPPSELGPAEPAKRAAAKQAPRGLKSSPGNQSRANQPAAAAARAEAKPAASVREQHQQPLAGTPPHKSLSKISSSAAQDKDRRTLSSEQLMKFVSTSVPKSKRVLCLIVRDKMSRLNKAKSSYFYPTYYLFVQAIVDIDEEIKQAASQLCSPHDTRLGCALKSGEGSRFLTGSQATEHSDFEPDEEEDEGEQAAHTKLFSPSAKNKNSNSTLENSFSASSSISADMLFINTTKSLKENKGMCSTPNVSSSMKGNRHSGNSYSDNEDPADVRPANMDSDADTSGSLAALKRPSNASSSLQGRDSPLVFPNGPGSPEVPAAPAVSSGQLGRAARSKRCANLLRKAGGQKSRPQRTTSVEALNRARLGQEAENDDDDEEGEEEEDDEEEEEEEEEDDDDESEDDDELTGTSSALNDTSSTATTTAGKPSADNLLLFDNDRNPYTGTYEVLLAGRKRKKAKTLNHYSYLMGLNELGYTRKNSICKLKSNVLGTQFNAIRLNHAENNDRCTIASISYETNVLGFKGPRKMRVFVAKEETKGVNNLPEVFKKNPSSVVQLKNMTPSWNVESQSYVLNFHGRVTQASVKNFQLVECSEESSQAANESQKVLSWLNNINGNSDNLDSPDTQPMMIDGFDRANKDHTLHASGRNSANQMRLNKAILPSLAYNSSIAMQFGRISNHEFTCDVTHPLSILQAFSIALSSFDSKLACE